MLLGNLRGDPAPLLWVLLVKNATACIHSTSVIWKTKPPPTLPCRTVGKKKLIKHLFLGFCSAIKVQSNGKPNSQPPIVRMISRDPELDTASWHKLKWAGLKLLAQSLHTNSHCFVPPGVVPCHPLDESSGQQQGGGFLGSYWFCHLLPESHRL